MIQRICQQCGVTYDTFPSIKPKFCSSACAGIFKRRGEERSCLHCGAKFYAQPSRVGKYCSQGCAMSARNLTDANPSFHRDISGEKNPMYGKGMTGEANPMYGKRGHLNPRWKGGRRVRKDGYVTVVAPDDHPYPCESFTSGTKRILEHRLIMEQHIGRYLLPSEVVHHIDGNPSNNAIDNLQLFSSQSEHVRIGHPGATLD